MALSNDDKTIVKDENSKTKVPETLVSQIVEFCRFIVPEEAVDAKIDRPHKIANRMISKICSRHSERLRRMEKIGKKIHGNASLFT